MKKRYADMQKTLQYTNSDGTVSALINTSVNMNFYREVTAQQPTAEREVTPEQPSHLNIQGDLGPSPTTKDGSVLGELLLCIQLLNDILKSHLTATASRSPMSPTYVYDSLANILSTITRRETHSLDNDDGSDRLKAEASTNLRIRLRKVVRDNNTESLNIGITEGSEVRNKIKLETNSEVVEDVPGGGNSDFKHHPTDGYVCSPSLTPVYRESPTLREGSANHELMGISNSTILRQFPCPRQFAWRPTPDHGSAQSWTAGITSMAGQLRKRWIVITTTSICLLLHSITATTGPAHIDRSGNPTASSTWRKPMVSFTFDRRTMVGNLMQQM